MDAVRDDPKVGTVLAFGFPECAERTWVAVVERSHSVEEMRDHRRAGADCICSFLERGFGVTDGEADAKLGDSGYCGRDAGDFWSGGNHGDGGAQTAAEVGEVVCAIAGLKVCEAVGSCLQHFEAVDAVFGWGDEGAFAVCT